MIENIEQAEQFVTNLKRSDNWVSNNELIAKLKQSYQLITESKREDLIPVTCVNIALYYIDLGEYGEAWQYTEIAKLRAEINKNYDAHLNALSLQYRIQRYLGNIDTAQELVNKQIEIALEYNDNTQLFSAYFNQGVQYSNQKLKEECLQTFEKALMYSNKTNNAYFIAMTNINYAGNLIEFGEFKKAKKILTQGMKIAKQNNYLNLVAISNSNFGELFLKENNYIKSIKHQLEAIKIFSQHNNSNEEIQAKIMLTEVYIKSGEFKKVEDLLESTLKFSEENNIKSNLENIFLRLSVLKELQFDYKNALDFFKKHKAVQEEIFNSETNKRIKNLEILQQINILKIERNNAESMANIKHDFLANMSHEIRTPINSVLGICYLLQQQSLNEIQYNYVNRLKRSGENLLGIINDVLDISKIESGKMELVESSFSLNTLLQDVYNTIEPKSIEKDLPFHIQKKYKNDILLNGDSVRLQQVLINLVANAIKFTSTGNVRLEVETTFVNEHKTQIVFTIIDTGIGIPKDKLNTIFGRYEQATAAIKTTFGGTGLGLSISKKIVELMQGTIAVKSKLKKGTQFIVTIPFEYKTNKQIEKVENKIKLNTELLNHKTILIADDNAENRLVAKDILSNSNKTITVYEAENGLEVLDILEKQKIDIIFIDLDMPLLNGIETIQKIRKNKKWKAVKIIGNTASIMTLTTDELLELGFDDFIFKPYKPEELLDKICTK